MKNNAIITIRISVLLFLFFSFVSCHYKEEKPIANNGVLDLNSWSFNSNLRIQGQWEFYPDQFPFNKDDEYSLKSLKTNESINFPRGLWYLNQHESKGYGTYRLKILLPNEVPPLMIKVLRVRSSCEVWVNNEKIGEIGRISKENSDYKPSGEVLYAKLSKSNSKELDLVIPVENYHHVKGGGFAFGIYISKEETLNKDRYWTFIWDSTTSFLLIIISIYNLVLFFLDKRKKILLYFAILCASIAIRHLFVGDVIIYKIYPEIPFVIVQIFRYIPLYFGLAFGVLYYNTLLPQEGKKWMEIVTVIVTGSMLVYVLFSSTYQSTHAPKIHIYYSWFFLFYVLYISILAVLKKRRFARYIIINTIIAVVIFANDLLHSENRIYTSFLSNIGLLFFLFNLNIINYFKNKEVFKKVNSLSSEVLKLKTTLDNKNEEMSVLVAESIKNLKSKLDLLQKLEEVNKQNSVGKELNSIIAELRSEKLDNKRLLTIKENLQHLNESFLEILKSKSSNLTKSDIEICSLIRIGMTTSDIAAIRSTSIFSVKAFRYRIRKKLNVPEELSLTEFIRNL